MLFDSINFFILNSYNKNMLPSVITADALEEKHGDDSSVEKGGANVVLMRFRKVGYAHLPAVRLGWNVRGR